MVLLVSLEEARAHLRILSDDELGDIERKLEEAEGRALTYIQAGETGWTADSVPAGVKTGVLLILAHLWEHRGEEDQGDPISPAVRSILAPYRMPVFA